jgi:hypothetical protein
MKNTTILSNEAVKAVDRKKKNTFFHPEIVAQVTSVSANLQRKIK